MLFENFFTMKSLQYERTTTILSRLGHAFFSHCDGKVSLAALVLCHHFDTWESEVLGAVESSFKLDNPYE